MGNNIAGNFEENVLIPYTAMPEDGWAGWYQNNVLLM